MSNLVSLIGWTFLPNLVTGWVQTIYYSLTIRAGSPKPRPGSPRYAEHRRLIHISVVTLYLLYTIYEADHELRSAGTFYSDLSLPLTASERDIKSRFRRLAALHHPDKVSGEDAGRVNDYFVHLKTASDTLLDPARRFAYERFGPDAVVWASQNRCVTIRDFVVRGAQMLVPYYAVAAAAMYAMGLFGSSSSPSTSAGWSWPPCSSSRSTSSCGPVDQPSSRSWLIPSWRFGDRDGRRTCRSR